jgi:Ca-activated chloride channel homolog
MMLSTLFLKLRLPRPVPLVVLLLLCVSGSSSFSLAQASQPTQVPPTPSGTTRDLAHPEIQPRLDLDRDPVPSPDSDDTAPVTTASPLDVDRSIAPQKKAGSVYMLHADVDEVLLNCTVIDEEGRTVPGLNQSDFRVWEDGVPQTVNSVLHQDLPVSIGILLDNSGSMRDKRTAVNTASLLLLKASNPLDEAFVVNFSDHAYLDQGFTTDRVALDRGLSRVDSRGTTALYDAAAASADELAKHAKHPKQVLLVITDGADNASRQTLEQAIRRVQNLGGPVVYSIGLLFDTGKEESARARNALETLSKETGGVAYFPQSLSEVDSIAAEVARDIRNQYIVDYHSSKPASLGGYRTVHVEARSAKQHGRLTVRTRRGYYAKTPAPLLTQTAQKTSQSSDDPNSSR